uniref:uncharacterized protein LOC122780004 isoform X2 n=1 Tax=Solea senegalensis TaxID=28829 RepID=UPI001CD8B346|nr:uncharacterized protein LOC122780004 isoform X2 [Solea senegalensis]
MSFTHCVVFVQASLHSGEKDSDLLASCNSVQKGGGPQREEEEILGTTATQGQTRVPHFKKKHITSRSGGTIFSLDDPGSASHVDKHLLCRNGPKRDPESVPAAGGAALSLTLTSELPEFVEKPSTLGMSRMRGEARVFWSHAPLTAGQTSVIGSSLGVRGQLQSCHSSEERSGVNFHRSSLFPPISRVRGGTDHQSRKIHRNCPHWEKKQE